MNDANARPDDHFGLCPFCRVQTPYCNVGADHFGICMEHKVFWPIGGNLFSSWRYESEDEWQRNRELLESFTHVEPFHWPREVATDEPVKEADSLPVGTAADWGFEFTPEPATGDFAEQLDELARSAQTLIEVVELEKSGLRDGDGYWIGCDAFGATVEKMTELLARTLKTRCEALAR